MIPSSVRVLLVEDSLSDARLVQEHLDLAGFERFEVTHVERLEEALARLRAEPFDVVLLDLSLPDSTGIDTFRRVQREAPHIPLVVLTGISDEMLGIEAVRNGIQDYLIKGQSDERQIARAIRYAIERKLAEVSLKQAQAVSERRAAELQAVFEALQEPLVVFDAAGTPTKANATAISAYGVDPTGIDLQSYAKLPWQFMMRRLDGRPVAHADLPSRRALRGETVRGEPYIFTNAQGKEAIFEVSAAPLWTGGKVAAVAAVWHDTTERQRTEDALRESEERHRQLSEELECKVEERTVDLRRLNQTLEQRSAQLRKLAAELTHAEERERRRLAQAIHDHLQQLLVGAKLCTDTLRRRGRTKAVQEVVRQLGEYVSESIDVSRSLTFELSPPVLYDFGLARALAWLGRWMEAKQGLTVEVQADEQAEPGSEDVKVLLFQAVRELLLNVVKHAQVKTAEVQMRRFKRDLVQIVIRDKGIGFDPSKCRGDDISRDGFGLFSIRGRLDLLGGQMEIDSAPGRGSCITLLAPLSRASVAGQAAAEAVAKPAAGPPLVKVSGRRGRTHARRKVRVLLADDHTLVRQGLVHLLQEHGGIEVVGEAGDGLAALEMAHQLEPDVILMDVDMPRLNGIEATSRVTAELPKVKVIGLSMLDESELGAAMREAGAIAYVNKTGPLETLLAAISNCFAGAK